MDFELFQDLPPTPPVVSDHKSNWSVSARQKQENTSIEHDTHKELLISEEEGYRIQAQVQWLGIRNALRGFLENYVFGHFQNAQYYHNMATSAFIMYNPRCKRTIKYQSDWGKWIKACGLLAKYVKKYQGTPDTRALNWKCHRCNQLVPAKEIVDITRWECTNCFLRAQIVQHLLLICEGNDVYKDLIFHMIKVGILELPSRFEVCTF